MGMSTRQHEISSLRPDRSDLERLGWALVISFLAHLVVWGGFVAGRQAGVWERLREISFFHPAALPLPPVARVEETLVFVDVSQASPDAPDKAKYYSDRNSRAANPDPDTADVPKITGTQTEVPKTETAARVSKLQPAPLQPAPPETKPARPLSPGALELARPEDASAQPGRPRTVKQALAQQDKLPGRQMQQSGGVPRRQLSASFDARATPFGAYDRAIVEAVTQRWYDLLDSQRFALDRTGKVTIHFRLNQDGTVTGLIIAESTVGEILGYVCREAIAQAGPFGKWPSDMRRLIGENFRDITFTFHYY